MSNITERAQAVVIAERFLDEPYADPDGDQCVLARQFNRSQEEIERLRNDTVPGMAARFAAVEAERDRLRSLVQRAHSILGPREAAVPSHKGAAWLSQATAELNGNATATKRAYYETHEPPHCPTCECGRASSEPSEPSDDHTRWLAETWQMIERCAVSLNPTDCVKLTPAGCAALVSERRSDAFRAVFGDQS